MKLTRIILLFIGAFSLNTHAQGLQDDEDLKTFEDTNYCQGCDISEARINGNHDNGFLLQSYAIRTRFAGSLYKMDFSGSIMTYSEIYKLFGDALNAQLTNFNKVNLSFANIKYVDMSGVKLIDTNLSNSDFFSVNFSGADFSNANLQGATIKESILIGSNLNEEQLKQIKSIECTIMPNGELYGEKHC